MKLHATLILILICLVGYSQTTEQDLFSVIEKGILTNKLPIQIINKAVDTLRLPPTIAVQCTPENRLKPYVSSQLDSIQIQTWDVKYMFLYDYYWITPSNIHAAPDKLIFDFDTHTIGRKATKYYSGRVKATKINGAWNITKVKTKEVNYTYDKKWTTYQK
jgi:hypothetical protein